MAKPRPAISLADQLRRLIVDSGHTAGSLAKLTGDEVDRFRVHRFITGERAITLASAGAIAAALGVEPLRVARKSRAAAKPKPAPPEAEE